MVFCYFVVVHCHYSLFLICSWDFIFRSNIGTCNFLFINVPPIDRSSLTNIEVCILVSLFLFSDLSSIYLSFCRLLEVLAVLEDFEDRDLHHVRCLWHLGKCNWELGGIYSLFIIEYCFFHVLVFMSLGLLSMLLWQTRLMH